jgi:small subunit ribosomal protein S2
MSSKTDNQFIVPLEDLLEAGCHFGHQAKRWFPKMAPYIWGERSGVHIFDLAKTQQLLLAAAVKVRDLVASGKTIVFLGTKRQASPIIKQEAERAGIPYAVNRWPGGLITNWKQIEKSILRLKELKSKKDSGDFAKYVKKEQAVVDKEISRLTRLFGGLENLSAVPDALFVVDIKREAGAIAEARRFGIFTIAIVDTNCNPDEVDVVIPANDDAVRSIHLIVNKFADAVIEGKNNQINKDNAT